MFFLLLLLLFVENPVLFRVVWGNKIPVCGHCVPPPSKQKKNNKIKNENMIMIHCQKSMNWLRGFKCICFLTADETDIRNYRVIINLEDTLISYTNKKIRKLSVG